MVWVMTDIRGLHVPSSLKEPAVSRLSCLKIRLQRRPTPPLACRESVGKASGKRRESVGKASGMILDACRDTPSITIAEIAKRIGITERSVQRNIQKLQSAGLLRRIGDRKEGYWQVIE